MLLSHTAYINKKLRLPYEFFASLQAHVGSVPYVTSTSTNLLHAQLPRTVYAPRVSHCPRAHSTRTGHVATAPTASAKHANLVPQALTVWGAGKFTMTCPISITMFFSKSLISHVDAWMMVFATVLPHPTCIHNIHTLLLAAIRTNLLSDQLDVRQTEAV